MDKVVRGDYLKNCSSFSATLETWLRSQSRRDRFLSIIEGTARTHIPHVRNCTAELLTFGVIARVSLSEVQWTDLALGQRSSWSSFDPRQVSMLLRQSSSYISTPVQVWGCGVFSSFEFSRCKSSFKQILMKLYLFTTFSQVFPPKKCLHINKFNW